MKKLYPLHEELDSIEKEAVKSVWQTPVDDKRFCASHGNESTDQAAASVSRRLTVYERHLLNDLEKDATRKHEWNEHHMGLEEDAKTANWSTELSGCSFASEKSNSDLSGKSASETYETGCETETHDWMLKNDLQRTRELYGISCSNVADKMSCQEQPSEDTLALYAVCYNGQLFCMATVDKSVSFCFFVVYRQYNAAYSSSSVCTLGAVAEA